MMLRRAGWTVRLVMLILVAGAIPAAAQGLGGAGTVQGTIKDPTGGVMQAVVVEIGNPVSGFSRTAATDAAGHYVFNNLAPNTYEIIVSAQGFKTLRHSVEVQTAVPITVDLTLDLAGTTSSVDVVGHNEALVERDPSAHTDLDQKVIARLPLEVTTGLNQVVTLASPGVVADSNGFFHPVGDHAQTQFSIDNQPVTDQQSKLYSNQLSADAVQSMEIITGVAPAEYGDKSSLVVHIVTKSGLNDSRPTGGLSFGYGSFNSPTADLSIGAGTASLGNFLSFSGTRTDRFLDPPEFTALHDSGTQTSFFDRLDARTPGQGTFHLNVQAGRSSFDVPNTLDNQAVGQQQHQQIRTINVAPGYARALGARTLLTANAFVRQDHVIYTPSPNPFADQPGSVSQNRTLTNIGVKADLAYVAGHNNVKGGVTVGATRLAEHFTIGFTDPTFNAPCLSASGDPVDDTMQTEPSQCSGALTVNPEFDPNLVAFDLTRGGTPFVYDQKGTISTQAAYLEDNIDAGPATLKFGVRLDHYRGLTSATLLQPRAGVSYAVGASHTVLRASYGRTMETPYNENLLLSSGVGAGALTGTASPPLPGRRNEMEVGVQQAISHWLVADVGYFYKRTRNAYDFNVLFDTPIFFPVSWDHSTISGFTSRVNLVEHGGLSAFVVMAHTNAIYAPPGTGGVLLETPCDGVGCTFRIDHDQKFNSTTNVQYIFDRDAGAWVSVNWRYDSGLVAGAVGDVLDLLSLTPDQQAAAGVSCAGLAATSTAGITNCAAQDLAASRLVIPAAGTGDPLNNPSRIAPRSLVDLGVGIDNLLRTRTTKVRLRFSIINVTNKETLYNFLSTFSGTHFVSPRAYQFQVGVTF